MIKALKMQCMGVLFRKSWLFQPGFPLFSIRFDDFGVQLTQSKYTFKANNDDTLWSLPLSAQFVYEQNGTFLITTAKNFGILRAKNTFLPCPSGTIFTVVNPGKIGMFRTFYSERIVYNRILSYYHLLQPLDLAGLVSDVVELTLRGTLDLELTNFFRFLGGTSSPVVWQTVIKTFRKLTIFKKSKTWNAFLHEVLRPHAIQLNFNSTGGQLFQIRKDFLEFCTWIGEPTTVERGLEFFEEVVDRKHVIDPSLRSIVYEIGARNGPKNYADLLISRLNQTKPDVDVLLALLATPYRKFILDNFTKKLPLREQFLIIKKLLYSQDGPETAWYLLEPDIDLIGSNSHASAILEECVSLLGESMYAKVRDKKNIAVQRGIEKNWNFKN
jgi:hypothetical protein